MHANPSQHTHTHSLTRGRYAEYAGGLDLGTKLAAFTAIFTLEKVCVCWGGGE